MKDSTSGQLRYESPTSGRMHDERSDNQLGVLWKIRLAARYVVKGPTSSRVYNEISDNQPGALWKIRLAVR